MKRVDCDGEAKISKEDLERSRQLGLRLTALFILLFFGFRFYSADPSAWLEISLEALTKVLLIFAGLHVLFAALGWLRYVRFFGYPPVKTWLRMPYLRYRAINGRKEAFVLAVLLAGGLILPWSMIVWDVPGPEVSIVIWLYLLGSVLFYCLPPAVLLLGNSTSECFVLRKKLEYILTCRWLLAGYQKVLMLLDPESAGSGAGKNVDDDNFRTRDHRVWRRTVQELVRCSPIVVIDLRSLSPCLAEEIEFVQRSPNKEGVYMISRLETECFPSDFGKNTISEEDSLRSVCRLLHAVELREQDHDSTVSPDPAHTRED